jgi:dienelactone hydrolase
MSRRIHPRAVIAIAAGVATVVLGAGLVAGCTGPRAGQALAAHAEQAVQPAAIAARPTPAKPLPVGVRNLTVTRGDRVLAVTILYPASGKAGGTALTDAPVANGTYPLVLFSHGLNALPSDYQPLLVQWAAAGFVVAAPAYPHTSRGVSEFNILDVLNQPVDASYVLTQVLARGTTAGDPLDGHLDPARVAAAGHSAGGITTVGMFTHNRDSRLRAGIVLAGNDLGMGTAFAGSAAQLLFVHGDNDPLVTYASGRHTYNKVPWSKAFLTVKGGDHSEPYLTQWSSAFRAVAATTTDFLRWSLYGDTAAKQRLGGDTDDNGVSAFDNSLG